MTNLTNFIQTIAAWFTRARVTALAILAAAAIFIATLTSILEDLGPEKKVEAPPSVVDESPAPVGDTLLDWTRTKVEDTLND